MIIVSREWQWNYRYFMNTILLPQFPKEWAILLAISTCLNFLVLPLNLAIYLSLPMPSLILFTFVFLSINFYLRKDTVAYQMYQFEIDFDFITIYLINGKYRDMSLEDIKQVLKKSSYYFIYISKRLFFYLPLKAFRSKEDIDRFELLLKTKRLI